MIEITAKLTSAHPPGGLPVVRCDLASGPDQTVAVLVTADIAGNLSYEEVKAGEFYRLRELADGLPTPSDAFTDPAHGIYPCSDKVRRKAIERLQAAHAKADPPEKFEHGTDKLPTPWK